MPIVTAFDPWAGQSWIFGLVLVVMVFAVAHGLMTERGSGIFFHAYGSDDRPEGRTGVGGTRHEEIRGYGRGTR